MKVIAGLILFLVTSCNTNMPKSGLETLHFGSFSIVTPNSWTKVKAQSLDSFVGEIAIDNTDTLYFDLGWYSNKLDKLKTEVVMWDTIDGRRCKIVYPAKSGIGTTGIYIDSLWQAGSDIDRFNLCGYNIKPENEKLVLQALKTLKFHKNN